METFNAILVSRKYQPLLNIIKGFRNGAVLVEQVQAILQATYTHSRNLASFVVTYKALRSALQHFDGKEHEYHSFIAAFIGGFLIWGKYNKINEQINLYLLSRVIYGLTKLAVEKGYLPTPKSDTFPLFGAIVWGIVLWLFEHHKHTLQGSLQSSMTYLYHDSNVWHNIWDFLIYNRL